MENLKKTIANYSNKDIEVRKHWYSPAAEAYNRVRPRYPQKLIKQVVEGEHPSRANASKYSI